MNKSLRVATITLGAIVGVAHIGVLGHLIDRTPRESLAPTVPTINIPDGPYSSYKIKAGKDGYEIEFRADDPKILESQKSLSLDKEKRGFFGGGTETRREWRRDQFTKDGTRNLGGAITQGEEGKSAKDIECIVADAGARSQGAMAGSSIAAGIGVPAVIGIPYVGWLAAGWISLLGGRIGSATGSTVGSILNDC
jgi:hypothetical protein